MSLSKYSMKDDQEFNIWFVKEIEKYSCLYNHADGNYSNRQKQDEAWLKIAESAKASVVDCRERWKNLRACFTRHLKHKMLEMKSGIKYKKPYYLADHMNFILPFTKLRSQSQEDMKYYGEVVKQTDFEDNKVIYVNPEVRNDDDCDSRFDFQTEMTYPNVVYDSNDHLTSNEGNVTENNDVTEYVDNKSQFECFSRKRPYDEDDPDMNFLKSLLPDMKAMDDNQKRKFKINVLKLSDNILNASN